MVSKLSAVNTKCVLAALVFLLISGCASNELVIEKELYNGVPFESLAQDDPSETEQEATARAETALGMGNYDLALYEYLRAAAFPKAEHRDQSFYRIGEIHLIRGNNALTERAFLKAVEVNPKHTGALEQLGILVSKNGRTEEGKTFFFRVISLDQERLERKFLADNYDALTEETVLGLSVDELSPHISYMGLGIISDLKANYIIAKRFYQKALQIDPRSVKAMLNLGYSYYMSGDYIAAKRLMSAALQYEPDNEKAMNNLALIHIALGETTRALNIFMNRMEAPEALNNVGYFLILQGKPEEAIPYLQEAIDKKASYYKLANDNLARALAEVRVKKIQKESTQE